MKAEIHPKYFTEAKVTCVCGNTFTTGSVAKEINIDICAACHPFFSGKQKLIDTEGRIEKFKKKYANFNLKAK
ncbi:MAG: 50S ribosomal protein L31 [Bdellovibrionales bacterium]|nr:50S ribosomal protein L31 [Bdellovibrionales bacterium]